MALTVSTTHNRCLSSGGLTDQISEYFSKLRWKAAETLTSTLNEEERSTILKNLDAVDEAEAEQKVQKSMGEAVAAARMEEAQKVTQQWESKKEQLEKQAEEAARARIESDLQIQKRRLAMEQWQKELAQEQQQQQESKLTEHPLLGTSIADFGYKQIYIVPAKLLSTIPVWKKQRIYRHDRAKIIMAEKAKTPHLGLPGIICLVEDKETGDLSILDGQHRVGALTLLAEKEDSAGIDVEHILVELYCNSRSEQLPAELFSEINKAEPIKLVDMPGVAKNQERKIITEGASRLADKFPDMFKPSQRCRSPHLNIDNLRDALFASNVLKRHDIKSPKKLVDWMMVQNEVLREFYKKEEHASKDRKSVV